ncbi:MAG: nitrilase-related carbon-nitrogen hydrolase [Holophagae bacterium]|jgi:predicted amidohydrolase
MIVAGIQYDISWENPQENFERVTPLAERAAEMGAVVIALPEMFATGFSMRAHEMAAHAELIREFIEDLAKRLDLWVIGGYAEPGEHLPANACTVVAPDGRETLHYRKIHPFSLAHEHEHFEAGNDVRTVEIAGVRVTPLVCYDLRFPELFRTVARDTDLFVVIANWPSRRAHAWRTLLAARAIDDQAWVLGVNRVGQAEGHPHRGDTSLLDPWGEVVATLANEPGAVVGEVDAAVIATVRQRFRFLDDRRPELYRRLEDER